jgi:succinate dehydrogenase / fumarate reductase, iron-sulfur subunit
VHVEKGTIHKESFWIPKYTVDAFDGKTLWLLIDEGLRGSCGMKINGIPRLACYTNVSQLEGDTITCAPLSNFPHIRDLVTDFSQFFDHHKSMQPFIHNKYADIKLNKAETTQKEDDNKNKKLGEFKQTPEDLDRYLQFSYCIKCGLCYSACPTAS